MIINRRPRLFYGYIIVIVSFIIMAASHGAISTFGVFFNPLSTEFGWTRATISGAASLCFFLMGLFGIIMGKLTDKFGPRIIMTICGSVLGLGFLLMSQLNTAWQLYLFYSLIVGFGVSSVDVSLLSTTARWFVKKRGIMSGLVKVGTGTGMLVMPILANWLISKYGWRQSYIVIAIIILIIVVAAAQLLRRDPSKTHQLSEVKELKTADTTNSAIKGLSLQESIHTRPFWIICAIYFLLLFSAQTVMIHINPYAIDLGFSEANAANILSIIGGASIFGRLAMGITGDRIGNKLSINICFCILLLAISWLQFSQELWMLYIFAIIYGFAHGGFFALISPTVADLFGTVSHGVIFGIIIFSGTVGGSIGSFLAGYMFDITNNYQIPFLICLGAVITGLTLSFLLKPINKY
ncbi:MAG: MFS transporter [Dehalococcoidales bacterium]|nr:MFS transporter [Dehalococcoidales bacterium]